MHESEHGFGREHTDPSRSSFLSVCSMPDRVIVGVRRQGLCHVRPERSEYLLSY
jgi:hypothetical protein